MAGRVLVAEPFIDRTCFNHGVLSLIDYNPEDGATGVVLNNRTEYMLAELIEGITAGTPIPVYCGGPTGQDRIYFVHTLGPDIIPDARPYADGLYVGGSFDAAADYVNGGYPTDGYIRFFIGYTNWVEGQLEKELASSVWATLPQALAPSQLLTDSGDRAWHNAVRALGGDFRSWRLIPRNPVCN